MSLPCALRFLLGFEGDVGGVTQEALPAIGNYLSFTTRFLFGFGVAFLLPVLLMVLERAGIVTREQLARSRRYAIVAAAGISAVLTPPDVVSMLLMLVPLYALYEFVRDPRDPADPLARVAQGHIQCVRSCGKKCGPENATGGGEGWRFRAHFVG